MKTFGLGALHADSEGSARGNEELGLCVASRAEGFADRANEFVRFTRFDQHTIGAGCFGSSDSSRRIGIHYENQGRRWSYAARRNHG